MFSYLRPHRRTPSAQSPTSPAPESHWEPSAHTHPIREEESLSSPGLLSPIERTGSGVFDNNWDTRPRLPSVRPESAGNGALLGSKTRIWSDENGRKGDHATEGSRKPLTSEPATQPRGKARFKISNPMALLQRRRTSQAVPTLSPESLMSNLSTNNTEPYVGLRGTIVHDFSAPKPRQNLSYDNVRSPDGDVPRSGGSSHTPVFTENFEEEQYPAAGPHVRRASDTELDSPRPPFAKGILRPVIESPTRELSERTLSEETPPPVPPKVEPVTEAPRRISYIEPASTPPKAMASTKKAGGRSRTVSGASAKDLALPRHMKSTKSTSSRFSFDIIGAAEQERLLEDRHRQKALEKALNPEEDEEEDEDDYNYDDMDDDDGLEERIPGVNADLDEHDEFEGWDGVADGSIDREYEDEEGEVDGHTDGNAYGFSFHSMSSPLSPDTPGSATTPRDIDGKVIGFAMTKNSPFLPSYPGQQLQDSSLTPTSPDAGIAERLEQGLHGLGVSGIDLGMRNDQEREFPQPDAFDDADFYFDSGIIDLAGDEGDAVEFDESVFDNADTDEYGRPLKTFVPTVQSKVCSSTLPPELPDAGEEEMEEAGNETIELPSEETPAIGSLAPKPSLLFDTIPSSTRSAPTMTITEAQTNIPSTSEGAPQDPLALGPSNIENGNLPPTSQILTQDSLAAYQSALAAAAFSAQANGKFTRSSPPASLNLDTPYDPYDDDNDDFDYDDALSDSSFIAAANAEALANDESGFYGQEFGFYSAPTTSVPSELGGLFVPRGNEGMIRSTSGRVVCREPNLTPITERSEYSNRNSLMSLGWGRGGLGSDIGSPGLAQLMSDGGYAEGDMSIGALLRLRRGAWGGSQASLHSSQGGTPNEEIGSPSWRGHARRVSADDERLPSPGPFSPPLTHAQARERGFGSGFGGGGQMYSSMDQELNPLRANPVNHYQQQPRIRDRPSLSLSVARVSSPAFLSPLPVPSPFLDPRTLQDMGRMGHRYSGSA